MGTSSYESIYLRATVLLLPLLLLRCLVLHDASLARRWDQLRNGLYSSKRFIMGGLRRFNGVGRGSVGPQMGVGGGGWGWGGVIFRKKRQ